MATNVRLHQIQIIRVSSSCNVVNPAALRTIDPIPELRVHLFCSQNKSRWSIRNLEIVATQLCYCQVKRMVMELTLGVEDPACLQCRAATYGILTKTEHCSSLSIEFIRFIMLGTQDLGPDTLYMAPTFDRVYQISHVRNLRLGTG